MNVSVVMTCHNEEAYIEHAVRSVTGQTAADRIAEIVVVEDGSTDGSAEVLARLAAEFPRLRVIRTAGIGLPAARNTGIRASTAPLIAFLDGDDYWVPDKLERQLPWFSHSESVGLVYSDYVDFSQPDASDALLVNVRRLRHDTPNTLAEYFVHDGPVVPSSTVMARAVFDDVGLFDEAVRVGEDTEMFLRVAERWQFQHVSGGLVYKRRHRSSISHRLDTLLPINVRLTEQFVRRIPSLAPLASQRLSRRYARVGNDCAQHGQYGLALSYLGRSLVHAPGFWRAYAYLALLLLPLPIRGTCLRVGKRLFHGGLHRLRDAAVAR